LTYFCQVSTADKDIDFDAVDQLYIAPGKVNIQVIFFSFRK